jgi:hypothetical protein
VFISSRLRDFAWISRSRRRRDAPQGPRNHGDRDENVPDVSLPVHEAEFVSSRRRLGVRASQVVILEHAVAFLFRREFQPAPLSFPVLFRCSVEPFELGIHEGDRRVLLDDDRGRPRRFEDGPVKRLGLADFFLHGLAVGDVHEMAENGRPALVGDGRHGFHDPPDLAGAGDDAELVRRRPHSAQHLTGLPLDGFQVVGVNEAVGPSSFNLLNPIARDGGDDRVDADEEAVLCDVHAHEGFLREGLEDVVAVMGAAGGGCAGSCFFVRFRYGVCLAG